MRKKLLIAVLSVLLLIPLMAAVMLGALWLRADLTPYKGIIVEQVRRATGRELVLNGELSWRFSLSPTVRMNDVAFANAAWGSRPYMVKAQYVEVELGLLPLLRKRLELARVVVRGADVVLETDLQGRGNWSLFHRAEAEQSATATSDQTRESPPPPTIDILIENSLLTLTNIEGTRHTVLNVDHWTAHAEALDAPVSIEFQGSWNGHELSWSGTTGRLLLLTREDMPYAMDLAVSALGVSGTLKGTVTAPFRQQGIDLELTAQATDLNQLRTLFGDVVPRIGPAKLAVHATGGTENLALSDIRATLAEGEISGSVNVRTDGVRPMLRATLDASRLNLAALLPWEHGGVDSMLYSEHLVDDELPFSALQALDLSLELQSTNLQLPDGLLLKHLRARAQLVDGRLTLSTFNVNANAFDLAGTLAIDARTPVPELDLSLDLPRIRSALVLGHERTQTNQINVAAQIKLASRGKSIRQLAHTLESASELTYSDATQGNHLTLHTQRDVPDDNAADAPILLMAEGQLDGQPVQMSAQLGAPVGLLPGAPPYPVAVEAQAFGMTTKLDGTVARPFAGEGLELAVHAQAEDLTALRPWFGDSIPPLAPVHLSLNAAGSPSALQISGLEARMGRARASGALSVHTDGPRPRLEGELSVSDLYTAEWQTRPRRTARTSGQARDHPILDAPLPFTGLHTLDAELQLSVRRLILPQFPIETLRLRLALAGGALQISDLRAASQTLDLNGQLSVDPAAKPPQVSLNLRIPRIDPTGFGVRPGDQGRTVNMDAAYRGTTRGTTLRGLVESLRGRGHLGYRQPSAGRDVSVRATLAGRGDAPIAIQATGKWDHQTVYASGEVGGLAKLLPGAPPYSVKLAGKALGITTHLDGLVTKPLSAAGLNLQVRAEAANLVGLEPWLGNAISLTEPVRLSTRMTGAADRLTLSELHIAGWDGSVAGQLTLDTGRGRPMLRGHLTLRDVALPRLLPERPPRPDETRVNTRERKVFSNHPILFAPLQQFNGDLTLHGINVTPPGYRTSEGGVIRNLEGRLRLEDGRLAFEVLQAASVAGDFVAEWQIDTTRVPPAVRLHINTQHYEVESLLKHTDLAGLVEGIAALDIELQARGNSVAEMAADLKGHMRLLMEHGRARIRRWDDLVGGTRAVLGHMLREDSTTSTINCALYDAEFKDGRTTALLGIVDTEYSTVFVEGGIDLENETLSLNATPAPKGVTLSVAAPVHITGPLAAPEYTLDISAPLFKLTELVTKVAYLPLLLTRYLDLGSGAENPCLSLAADSPEQPTSIERIDRAAGDAARRAGRALGTLFGGAPEPGESADQEAE